MNTLDLLPKPVYAAMELLMSDEPEKIDEGYNQLKTLADNGDMTAAACVGYASQFDHLNHYDLEACREYLQKSANADNPIGQYYLGMMLFSGDKPFQQDKVHGKWLLDQAEKSGIEDATRFKKCMYWKPTRKEARRMVLKSSLILVWEKIKHPFR